MSTPNIKIVLLGPPTCGKGTRAKMIAQELGLRHISTGDMFREIVKEVSELGTKVKALLDAGELVPDDITNEIVRNHLAGIEGGWVLDGYPRNLAQAQVLDEITQIDKAFYITVSDQEIERRVVKRRVCPNCGGIYHIEDGPPKVDGLCDNCAAALIHRLDDTLEVIQNRLKIYYEQTHPIVDVYKERGILTEVSGEGEKAVGLAEILNHARALLR